MAMIGRNAAVAEVGKHRHQVEGPLAFAAWLGVHAMLLSGVHSKTDAFLTWAWDYFDRDHAATIEAHAAPPAHRLGRPTSADVPHIVARRAAPGTPPATSRPPTEERPDHGRPLRRDHRRVRAGGGTLAHRLAPSGKRILILERGDWLPREIENWDATAVFVDNRYVSTGHLVRRATARRSSPRSTTSSAARRSSTAPRCTGSGSATSASSSTTAASHRPGRSTTTCSSRTTRRPRSSTRCTAPAARIPPSHRRRRRTPTRRSRTSRASSSSSTTWPGRAAPVPLAVGHHARRGRARPSAPCIRCATCDGFPCLVHAKSDADVIAVRPALEHDNVDARPQRRRTPARDRRVRVAR